jgi:hypothetical protein
MNLKNKKITLQVVKNNDNIITVLFSFPEERLLFPANNMHRCGFE